MSEGFSDNPPPKKPGIVGEIIRTVKRSLPWDPIGKKKKINYAYPRKVFASK